MLRHWNPYFEREIDLIEEKKQDWKDLYYDEIIKQENWIPVSSTGMTKNDHRDEKRKAAWMTNGCERRCIQEIQPSIAVQKEKILYLYLKTHSIDNVQININNAKKKFRGAYEFNHY